MAALKTKPFLPIIFLVAALIFAASLMLKTAKEDSATMDELAHIPAGYSYVKFLDFRLNPEHPPLLKALSALPLLSLNLQFNLDHPSWRKDVNGQWDAGNQFLYNSGNDADKIIFLARIFPIILTLLSAILIYAWSKEFLGKWWALLPSSAFSLSPTILAHGHYVTTDIAATFGAIFASYFLIKFLMKPKKTTLFFAGVGLGVAELLKFSLVLLIPYFLIVTILFLIFFLKKFNFLFYLKSLFFIFLIALALIYAVYFLFTLNYPIEKQKTDTTTILTSFSPRWLAEIPIKMSENHITKPFAHYVLGFLMVLQRSAGGNTGYFLGEVSAAGSRLYFPLVYLMKEPLPILILLFFSLAAGVIMLWKKIFSKTGNGFRSFFNNYFTEIAVFLFILIYWGWSIKSPLNIGVRHLIPSLPFIYILIAQIIKQSKLPFKNLIVPAFLFWLIAETAFCSPYFLSYFNEATGGVNYGYRYVTDSNYDWGQDLKRLKKWAEEKNIQKIAVDYFGGGNPKYYLADIEENWRSARGNPKDFGIEWLAVSVNSLQSAFGKTATGFMRNPADEYAWLKEKKPTLNVFGEVPTPDLKAGTSIFIYHL